MADLSKVVFLIGGVRTGTHVLRKMLATHPEIYDLGEVFNSKNDWGFYPYWAKEILQTADSIFPENHLRVFKRYIQSLDYPDKVVILDVKYEHFGLINKPWSPPFMMPLILTFLLNRGVRFIHLRRNALESILSNKLAIWSGTYHVPADHSAGLSESASQCTVDPAELLSEVLHRRKVTRYVSQLKRGRSITLQYEKLFSVEEGQQVFSESLCAELASFLEVSNSFNRVPALRKTVDRPFSELIANYAAVEPIIRKYGMDDA